MMNLFQLQEQLKDFSKDQLVREMQSPSGSAPPFLIMTELQRRTRMENAAALDKGPPTSTVAQDAVNAAGVPQGGIADMARAMAPQTDMTQNTGAMTPQAGVAPQGAAPVQAMQEGGLAGISRDVSDYRAESDPAVALMADRLGMSPDEYLASLDPEVRAQNLRRIERNRMLAMEPEGDGMAFPTQADLDRRFREPDVTPEMLTERGILQGGVNPSYVESDAVPTYFPDVAINSTMSDGVALPVAPEELAPYAPPSGAPFTADDKAEALAAINEGRPYRPSPRMRSAPGSLALPGADVVDVRTSAADAPPMPVDEYLSAIPPGALTEGLRPRTERTIDAALDRRMGSDAAARSFSTEDMNPAQQEYFATLTPEQQTNVRLYGVPDVTNTRTVASEANALDAILQGADNLVTQSNLGTTAGPTEDLGAMTTEELLPAAPDAPEAPVLTPEPPATTTTAPSGTASGATVGGMAVPPPQTDEDRMLQQDKWLALARFGAALASSQAPTFGQAFGQATQVGLDALGQARQDFLERKKAADDMAMQRAALAARMAGRGGAPTPRAIPVGAAGIFDDQIDSLRQQLLMAETPYEETQIKDQLTGLENMRAALAMQFASQYLPDVDTLIAPQAPEAPSVDVTGAGEVSTMDRIRGFFD